MTNICVIKQGHHWFVLWLVVGYKLSLETMEQNRNYGHSLEYGFETIVLQPDLNWACAFQTCLRPSPKSVVSYLRRYFKASLNLIIKNNHHTFWNWNCLCPPYPTKQKVDKIYHISFIFKSYFYKGVLRSWKMIIWVTKVYRIYTNASSTFHKFHC